MGTNYYWSKIDNHCDHCKRFDVTEMLHIGKSSAGWCFSVRVHPDREAPDGTSSPIVSLDDWKKIWASGGIIKDEYGKVMSPEGMLAVITERKWHDSPNDKRFEEARALRGPNNLLRHRLDDGMTVGHGEGPWDYVEREFS
jgi:hypothetical protein